MECGSGRYFKRYFEVIFLFSFFVDEGLGEMMLFFVENKLLLGVVGIVLLFVVVGFVVSWGFYCKKFLDVFFKVYFEYSLVVKYVFEYGICELLLFMKFR